MSRSLSKRSEVMPIRGSPNGARHCPPHLPQPGRDRSEQVDAINRNDWTPSIGNSGRHQSVRPQLMEKAEKLRKFDPDLSLDQAFAKVYTNPVNANLAEQERRENRPQSTTDKYGRH